MNAKIREAQTKKIPYMLVVGQKEVDEGKVAPRTRGNEQRPAVSVADFISVLLAKVANKDLDV
jgi:threonyl-tRNA synthetase